MPIRCYAEYCNVAQVKASNRLWGATVITVYDKKRCKYRCLQLKGLHTTAQSRPSKAGPVLPALQRRPADWSPSLLPGFPPGPRLAALQRVLTRLHYMRLPLSSAGQLLTALESGPAAPLPPSRVWMRFRMGGCVSPGGAHAVGHSPKHLAQVALHSIYLVICRGTMLALQFNL